MAHDPHITITDIRRVFCVKGAKKAFDSAGLNFEHFIKNGCLASELMGHGHDAVVERIVNSLIEKGVDDGR